MSHSHDIASAVLSLEMFRHGTESMMPQEVTRNLTKSPDATDAVQSTVGADIQHTEQTQSVRGESHDISSRSAAPNAAQSFQPAYDTLDDHPGPIPDIQSVNSAAEAVQPTQHPSPHPNITADHPLDLSSPIDSAPRIQEVGLTIPRHVPCWLDDSDLFEVERGTRTQRPSWLQIRQDQDR